MNKMKWFSLGFPLVSNCALAPPTTQSPPTKNHEKGLSIFPRLIFTAQAPPLFM